MGSFPKITIGFIPRERFSLSAEALRRIFAHTACPFRLIIVDCNIPATYRHEIDSAIRDHTNVEVLSINRYLLPNESRNLVIEKSNADFICLIDNDVFVEENWLSLLVSACQETRSDVARPLIFEGEKVHHDNKLGPVTSVPGCNERWLQIGRVAHPDEYDPQRGRRRVEWVENHCLLFRREVFRRIGPLDQRLSSREHVDLSLALRAADIPVVYEPRSRVRFMSPPPVLPNERPFFFFRWNLDETARSNAYLRTKWNLANYHSSIDWVITRHACASHENSLIRKVTRRVTRLVRMSKQAIPFTTRKPAKPEQIHDWDGMPGIVTRPLLIPVVEECTDYIRCGDVTFGVEWRTPLKGAWGVSLHVFTGPQGALVERFRIDYLSDRSHYHYIFHEKGCHQKFWIDPLVVDNFEEWSLDFLKLHLSEILEKVGGAAERPSVNRDEIERVIPRLTEAIRNASRMVQERTFVAKS